MTASSMTSAADTRPPKRVRVCYLSVVTSASGPHHVDRLDGTWKRQGAGLCLDRGAGRAREAWPGLHPHGVLRPFPRFPGSTLREGGARAHAGGPEAAPPVPPPGEEAPPRPPWP